LGEVALTFGEDEDGSCELGEEKTWEQRERELAQPKRGKEGQKSDLGSIGRGEASLGSFTFFHQLYVTSDLVPFEIFSKISLFMKIL